MSASEASLPPVARSPFGEIFDACAEAAHGGLVLPRCGGCGAWIHPARNFCPACLGEDLRAEELREAVGALVSWTRLHASLEPWFRDRLPWDVGLVRLDAGPNLVVHLGDGLERRIGARARVLAVRDAAGRRVLVAVSRDRDVPGRGGRSARLEEFVARAAGAAKNPAETTEIKERS